MSDQELSEREKLEREKMRNQRDMEKIKAQEERDKLRRKKGPSTLGKVGAATGKGAASIIKKLIFDK